MDICEFLAGLNLYCLAWIVGGGWVAFLLLVPILEIREKFGEPPPRITIQQPVLPEQLSSKDCRRFLETGVWPSPPASTLPDLEARPALVRSDNFPTVETAGWSDERWQADETWWSDGYHLKHTAGRLAPRPQRLRSELSWPMSRVTCRLFDYWESAHIALVPLKQSWHYEVHTLAGRTGLTIAPVTDGSRNGCHRVDGWVITYTGRALAGPYDFIEEVQLLAMFLVCFDWTRPPEAFSRREVMTVLRLTQEFNAELAQFRATLRRAVDDFLDDEEQAFEEPV